MTGAGDSLGRDDAARLRRLVPGVIAIVVRRGADFEEAEDAVQEALVDALRSWSEGRPRDEKAWLVQVAWRRHLDSVRSRATRRLREERVESWRRPDAGSSIDDSLSMFFLCAHPSLTPSSAVALTLRAVGGLTTGQIAEAYLVPESTMAQRISRAKRTIAGRRLDEPGDVSTVLRTLYLVFNEGHSGDIDLAAEAIRLTRLMHAGVDHPEVAGLLALMLLHHARRDSRRSGGRMVALPDQDRSRWDTGLISEGVGILQSALERQQIGEYQAQAAIAALHADAASTAETDWAQILSWYDQLVAVTDSPIARLNRVVALAEADGPQAGLAALATLDPGLPRHGAVSAWLHERAGDDEAAARLYSQAALAATDLAEREHLARQAARLSR